jgi:hypothetical protein
MNTPQEVQVWFILPAVRRQIAINLKKEGLKQKEIAIVLNLTESAVSQYLKKKRGDDVAFSPEINKEISASAELIAKDKKTLCVEIQRILKKIKDTRFICSVCHDYTHTAEECEICYV